MNDTLWCYRKWNNGSGSGLVWKNEKIVFKNKYVKMRCCALVKALSPGNELQKLDNLFVGGNLYQGVKGKK